MEEYLQKLKLVDYLTVEITIQKNDFISKLQQHVDEESTGMFSDTFEAFSKSKNEYKGHVGYDGFEIKRKRKIFESNANFAVASGTYQQKNEKLIIETKINGFTKKLIPFYVFAVLFYIVFITLFFSSSTGFGDGIGYFVLLFICFHAVMMLGIPFFYMRRSTSKMKHDLEREFFFISKK